MRLVLAILLAGAALASPASAATVSVVVADSCNGDVACSKYAGGMPVPVTTFAGAPGEASRLTVSREGAEFVFRDEGAPLAALAPCRTVDAATARCPVTEGYQAIRGLAVTLGDGDDAATVAGDPAVETVISGGDGADALTGGGGNDLIDGGPGSDRLVGGQGFDELSYAGHTVAVDVDLAAGRGGAAGEQDVLTGFETLIGGPRADGLRGSPRTDVIDGGTGDDAILGGAGDDLLFGDLGADRLSGEAGRDALYGDPAQGDDYYTPLVKLGADRLSGGRGDDRLHDTGGRNVFLGGPGRDLLEGGADRDLMRAGAGADTVDVAGGGRDRVDCGDGRDRARTDARRDTRRSCERVLLSGSRP